MMPITETVKHLLIINVLLFIGAHFIPEIQAFFPMYYFENPDFGFWQPLTSMFMHGSFSHILFNMFGLYMFGSALEHFWGGKKFLFFYISCGLGAAALQLGINYLEYLNMVDGLSGLGLSETTIHQIANVRRWDYNGVPRSEAFNSGANEILRKAGNIKQFTVAESRAIVDTAAHVQGAMVGASGAVYGLLVAFAFMFPNAELMLMFIPIPIKAKYFVPALLAIDLFLGFKG